MALIVEDGSIVAGAESYVPVAFADTYFSNRPTDPNAALWAALQLAQKESCLRQATDHMTRTYRLNWDGYRVSKNQVLDWPRYGLTRDNFYVVPFTSVPNEIQVGCCEYAVRASVGPLRPDLERPEAKVKIGSLEIDYSTSAPWQTSYADVVNVFGMFLRRGASSSNMARLVRV